MNKILVFVTVILSLVGSGCSSHNLKKTNFNAQVNPLKEARVFQKDKLARGGNLLVVPFTAGVGVEASDDLDHVALQVVKGIADALQDKGTSFKILVGENAETADFVIRGRIIQMDKKSKTASFGLEGSVLGVSDDEILAKFSQNQKSKNKADTFELMGYRTGIEIGQFLLTASD